MYREICPPHLLNVLAYVMRSILPERRGAFSPITEKDVCKEDKEFVLKIMRLETDREGVVEGWGWD